VNTTEKTTGNVETIDAVTLAVEGYFAELEPLPMSQQAKAWTTIAKMGEITTIKDNVVTFHLSRLYEV
jgi:hypothetical protein